ncbi:Uncharacterised protein [Neisseria animaloris]|uniref:hypothetical protein n=1 Tax=Neisseria animaloris TaxID=326522 RepID=UPI000A18CEFC|nr:hypothetical protein [Neisseria animaloris]OSI06697.1 hypothetical protein BWD08_11080 [Neisseria animaloris]VEH88465.1 Uncharacterised protein [Neisseria animaloris]
MEGIFINGNPENSQIEISGTVVSFNVLGDILNKITTMTSFKLQTFSNKFYPKKFEFLQLIYQDDETNRISIETEDDKLIIKGNSVAFNMLGDSLSNFFDEESKKDDHFHIDYYDGNDMLNPTNISLVFICL